MAEKRYLLGVAATATYRFVPYFNRVTVPDNLKVVNVARNLALTCCGKGAFVYATFDPATNPDEASVKLKQLWVSNQYRR